jgi:PPP family 3-phenylpropionic acid transporter
VVSLLVAAYLVLLLAALALPSAATQHEERPSAPLTEVLRQGNYLLLLGSAAMCQAAHGFFYSFGTFYWLEGGLSTSEIGWLWAGGVVSEVVIFSLAHRLAGIASPVMVIGLGCLTGIVRWSLLSASDGLAMAVAVQILQGGTLAFTHIGAARYLAAATPAKLSSSATGLYSACGYGLFMGVGVFAGGYLFNRIGGGIFLIAAGVCAFGLLCAAGLGWWHRQYPIAAASELS